MEDSALALTDPVAGIAQHDPKGRRRRAGDGRRDQRTCNREQRDKVTGEMTSGHHRDHRS
jgi:hypothetical protein